MSTQEKRSTRKLEMFQIIEQQLSSGLSQVEFCKKQKMSIATFSYWRKKYLTEKAEPVSPQFIPITIKTPPRGSSPIEIQLPNQIIVRCEDWQTEQLSTLILELQKI